MPRKWMTVLLLIVMAALLHAGLVRYDVDVIHTNRDGTVTQSISTPPFYGALTDMRMTSCNPRQNTPPWDCSQAALSGAFTRTPSPWFLALAAGIILPFGFLCAAGLLAISQLAGWPRVLAGIGLVVAAIAAALAALMIMAGSSLSMLFTWNAAFISKLEELANGGVLLLGGAIALACLTGGILLLMEAWRGRKRA